MINQPWFTSVYVSAPPGLPPCTSNWGSCKPAGHGSMKNRSEKLFIMDHGLMLMICEICVGFLRICSYSRLHMVYRQQQVGYPMRTVIQEKWRVRKKHKSSIYRSIFHYKPSIMGIPIYGKPQIEHHKINFIKQRCHPLGSGCLILKMKNVRDDFPNINVHV